MANDAVPSLAQSRTDRTGRKLIALLLAYAMFGFWCSLHYRYTTDDAYITFRFAENLARGQGLVYNPGDRVEGFSNPLWTLTLAGASSVGLSTVVTAKVLGGLCGAALLLLGLGIATRIYPFPGMRSLVVLGPMAAMPALSLYAVGGLETIPYACLLAGALYLAMGERWGPALCLTGLAAWTRPEGFLLAAVFVFLAGLEAWRRPDLRRPVAVGAAVCVGLVGSLFAARYAYYGRLLPNTYYAKPYGVLTSMPATFVEEIAAFLAATGGPLCVAVLVAALAQRPLRRRLMPIIAALLVEVAVTIRAGGDWMPDFRFLAPVLVPTVAASVALLLRYLHRSGARIGVLAPALAVVWMCLGVGQTINQLGRLHAGGWPEGLMNGETQVEAGTWFGEHYPPPTTLAVMRIGAIGYCSGLRIVDTLGLVDRRIADIQHQAGNDHERAADASADEVLRRRPDLVVLCPQVPSAAAPSSYTEEDLDAVMSRIDRALMRRLRAGGYGFAFSLSQGRLGRLWVFERER